MNIEHNRIEADVKSRPKKAHRKKTYMISFLAVMIAFTMVASAAVLTYYGKIVTTATVEQSVVISDDAETWLDYETPITRDFGETYAGCCFGYKDWI